MKQEHEREIRQLWHAATTYWDLAKKLSKALPADKMQLTSEAIARPYTTAIPTVQDEWGPSILGAHLNSAAIRFATIDERFKEEQQGRVFDYYIDEFDNYAVKDSATAQSLLTSRFDEFVHQLLRDNVAHIENPQKGISAERKILFQARQTVLLGKTLGEQFEALQGVMATFESELIKRGVIAELP